MNPSVLTCPHCGAPLAVSRFARTVVCAYCEATVRVDPSAVSVQRYREALAQWNHPVGSDDAVRFSLGEQLWDEQRLLARGEISDVYLAKRARWPSELVLLKVVRDGADAPLLQHELDVLQRLRAAAESQQVNLGARVPQPIVSGTLADGRAAAAYRWAGGFVHTFEAIRSAHPQGIEPVASIWVWRRLLEVVGVMRTAGIVHGSILPNHVLIENGEHGTRLAGFSCADAPNAPLRAVATAFEDFYPASMLSSGKLTKSADLVMSARCVAYLLGEDRRRMPAPLAELLGRIGTDDEHADRDPWQLHQEVGRLGRSLFGPPAFHPLAAN